MELSAFTATAKGTGISLDWATALEKNNAYFDIQRSTNGEGFQTIATVAGQGNTAPTTYTVLDRAPLTGVAYYRLRQVDTNGSASYSPVATAHWGKASVQVYPNPSRGMLYLHGTTGPVQYCILSLHGQQLRAGETQSATGVDVQQLPAGVYMLEMRTAQGPTMQRFTRE